MNEEKSEDRCLINGCQDKITCSFCGGCEKHHIINLENGNCNVQEEMEKEMNKIELTNKTEEEIKEIKENFPEGNEEEIENKMYWVFKNKVEYGV